MATIGMTFNQKEMNNKIIKRYAQRSDGKNGSIKEVWQDDDIKMSIKAILFNNYAKWELNNKIQYLINEILNARNVVSIESPYINHYLL